MYVCCSVVNAVKRVFSSHTVDTSDETDTGICGIDVSVNG